jgi:hypothetical protein
MPSFKRGIAACIGAVAMAMMAQVAHGKTHRSFSVPAYPVSTETLQVGSDWVCAGVGYHNPDETRATVWGLSPAGAEVQRAPYDFMGQWAIADACPAAGGWNWGAGVQYGAHISDDAVNQFVTVGYRISLGDDADLRVEGGLIYNGSNPHRVKHPITVNSWGFFPFLAVEFGGRWW